MTDTTNTEDLSEQELEDLLNNPNTNTDDDEDTDKDNNDWDDSDADDDDNDDEDDKWKDDNDDEDADGNDDDSSKKQGWFQKLLKQRAEARDQVIERDKKIADQDKIIAELKAGKDEDITDTERQEKLLDARMDKRFLEQEMKREESDSLRVRTSEVSSFVDENPSIWEHKEDFQKACENYPNLTPRNVFAIMKDELWLKETSQDKWGYWVAWTWSKRSTWSKKPSDMSEQELESKISKWMSDGSLWGE